MIVPTHFLKQFHPEFADADELAAKVKEAGFDEWTQIIGQHLGSRRIYTPGDPTLSAWQAVTDPASTRLVMERNPYFWKVDTAGRQLPYIDTVTFDLATDGEAINLKASAGEVDFQFRHLNPTNFTLFKENEERGGYRTLTYIHDKEQSAIISINLTNKDPNIRAVVSDARFRKAMSYALNRNDINELVYGGLAGPPSQVVPFPESPFHLAELASAYVEYDPEQANALLDEMGLTGRDGNGFRLRPDGETMSLTVEITDGVRGCRRADQGVLGGGRRQDQPQSDRTLPVATALRVQRHGREHVERHRGDDAADLAALLRAHRRSGAVGTGLAVLVRERRRAR